MVNMRFREHYAFFINQSCILFVEICNFPDYFVAAEIQKSTWYSFCKVFVEDSVILQKCMLDLALHNLNITSCQCLVKIMLLIHSLKNQCNIETQNWRQYLKYCRLQESATLEMHSLTAGVYLYTIARVHNIKTIHKTEHLV